MKYVLLAYRDEGRWEAASSGERDEFEAACRASEQDLRHSRHLVDVQGLQSSPALTVRVLNGEVSLAEGPVAETQGQLTQLLFIRARDLNEAIQIGAKLPQARAGPIEVRAIKE